MSITPASLSFKYQAAKHASVKWSIELDEVKKQNSRRRNSCLAQRVVK